MLTKKIAGLIAAGAIAAVSAAALTGSTTARTLPSVGPLKPGIPVVYTCYRGFKKIGHPNSYLCRRFIPALRLCKPNMVASALVVRKTRRGVHLSYRCMKAPH